ncbi:MAG: hypothetical protein RL215_2710, partial [Planctomycetota bacterium]
MSSWRVHRAAAVLPILTAVICLVWMTGRPFSSVQPGNRSATTGGEVPGSQSRTGPPRLTQAGLVRWVSVPELPQELVILESVFWEPADTESLRRRILESGHLSGAHVLEIGTGSGLLSLCCLSAGAARVIATDLNPAAIDNVRENARLMGIEGRLDARLVPRRDPSAWSVVGRGERFDMIISNPPWEDRRPESVSEFALYDPGFLLLRSLLSGVRERLRPGGRMWLAYGCRTAIEKIRELAVAEGLVCELLDERRLE